ncbi:MAG: alpha/beta hydrolase [Burkholderiales bacterium]|nr:alpha/beta hydrolase [Burkholderiales bacterium]
MSLPASPLTRALGLLALALAAALALVACAPVASLNALTPGDTYRPTRDVAYGPLPRQRLDVYAPVSPAPAPGWPVVVFFYGGSWTSGERADYKFVGEALASRGVLVLVADYRLYPEVRYPAFLEDSALALAWGMEHARSLGGNPRRLFVMGHSAGGYNAAMLALDPRWLAATGHAPAELAGWIGLAGAYEFLPLGPDSPARPVFFHPDYPAGTQPIDYAAPHSLKAFLGVPLHDKVVSPERSTLAMAKKLTAAGVPVALKVYDGVSHALLAGAFARPLRGLAPVLDDVSAWISAN